MALSMFGASAAAAVTTRKNAGPSTGRARRGMKTDHSTAPDSTVPPSHLDSSRDNHAAAAAAVAAAAAAAFSAGLTHPMLSSSHAAALIRASAATQSALMGLHTLGLPSGMGRSLGREPGGGGAATGIPVHLHATLASGPTLFQHFNWSKLTQPMPTAASAPAPRAAPAAASRRQRKPNGRRAKIKVETEVISHMDITTSEPPLSPPTSGSSPPSTSGGEPGGKAVSSGASSAGEPGKDGGASRDKVFECRVCNRCFGYKHVLQNHERTHTGEKPFACPECNKRFTRDHHLKTHMRLHTGEKPYHCTHCERQFVQVANLRRHLRVHTGERPYACELCISRFSDSNQLKAHMLIHKGEKPFGCILCGGRFRRRHHLMHHKCPVSNRTKSGVGSRRKEEVVTPMEELEEEEMDEEMEVAAVADDGDAEDEDDAPIFQDTLVKKRERKPRDIRRVVRTPKCEVSPLPSPPEEPISTCQLPEQTEPEDLSMNTMINNNNNNNTILVSGNGLSHRLRRLREGSFTSSEDEEEVHRRCKLMTTATEPVSPAAFLTHRHPKFRRHIAADATQGAPPIS